MPEHTRDTRDIRDLDPGEEQDGRYMGLLAPKVSFREAEDLEAERDDRTELRRP